MMTRRELAYLLIGLGAGLLLTVAAVMEFVMWFHHMFAVGFMWRPASVVLALPFLLIAAGFALLRNNPRE